MRVFALICALFLACTPARAQENRLLVFAAASLTEAMTEVGEAYAQSGKPKPVFLKAGDTMSLGIEGLGEQHQKVVAYKKH